MTLKTWHYENECPECGKNWGEHRCGYSASKCKMGIPDPPTKLQEAIEEVKEMSDRIAGWRDNDFYSFERQTAKAIATILNAVVKGELK